VKPSGLRLPDPPAIGRNNVLQLSTAVDVIVTVFRLPGQFKAAFVLGFQGAGCFLATMSKARSVVSNKNRLSAFPVFPFFKRSTARLADRCHSQATKEKIQNPEGRRSLIGI